MGQQGFELRAVTRADAEVCYFKANGNKQLFANRSDRLTGRKDRQITATRYYLKIETGTQYHHQGANTC